MRFEDLDSKVQDYLNERFSYYDRTGKEAFNESHIFPDELKELEPDALIELLEHKDISHIFAQSKYPELKSELKNMILEDSSVNRARRSRTMTIEEQDEAMEDLLQDIEDGDVNDDGILDLYSSLEKADQYTDLAEIMDELTTFGLFMLGVQIIREINSGNISINKRPKYITKKIGKRVVRLVIIGLLLKTKEPIIITTTVAAILYKNKKSFNQIYSLTKNIPKYVNNYLEDRKYVKGIFQRVGIKRKIFEAELKLKGEKQLYNFEYLHKPKYYGRYIFDLEVNYHDSNDISRWFFKHVTAQYYDKSRDYTSGWVRYAPLTVFEELAELSNAPKWNYTVQEDMYSPLYNPYEGDKLNFKIKNNSEPSEKDREKFIEYWEGNGSDDYGLWLQKLESFELSTLMQSSYFDFIFALNKIQKNLNFKFRGFFMLIEPFRSDETSDIIFEAPKFEPKHI